MSLILSLSHSLPWFCPIASILRYCVLAGGYQQVSVPSGSILEAKTTHLCPSFPGHCFVVTCWLFLGHVTIPEPITMARLMSWPG